MHSRPVTWLFFVSKQHVEHEDLKRRSETESDGYGRKEKEYDEGVDGRGTIGGVSTLTTRLS